MSEPKATIGNLRERIRKNAAHKAAGVEAEAKSRNPAGPLPPAASFIGKLSVFLLFACTVLSFSYAFTGSPIFGLNPRALLKLVPVRKDASVPPAAVSTAPPSASPTKAPKAATPKKRQPITLTPAELKQYDGTDPSKPIYLAINGKVYDVTAGRDFYGPQGGYKFFAGVDAARAYITGCFETHLIPDLRGLTEAEIESLSTWTEFYENSDKYFYVGRVIHDPIPDDAPLPEPCNQ
ncbi:hypothetical protein HDU98_002213 [Podochytrium sp. JEL0797]|nr:hypothetical protein HDU98_002213 [Podochytrium sp. JEL0797]